jgi:hypothetical protein
VSDIRVARLRELSVAVSKNRRDEFTMRVPAEPDRDADLVLSWAADEIDRLLAENAALRELLKECATPGVCHFDLGVKIDKTLAALERKP